MSDDLSSWNGGPAGAAILEFVRSVSTPVSAFAPVEGARQGWTVVSRREDLATVSGDGDAPA